MSRITLSLPCALLVVACGGGGGDDTAAQQAVQPIAPQIVNEPADVLAGEGQLARFSAAALSTLAHTLQWQVRRNGDGDFAALAMAGATSLSFVAQAQDDGALYRMCAANVAGLRCSRGARLSVIARPVQPASAQRLPSPAAGGELGGVSADRNVLAPTQVRDPNLD